MPFVIECYKVVTITGMLHVVIECYKVFAITGMLHLVIECYKVFAITGKLHIVTECYQVTKALKKCLDIGNSYIKLPMYLCFKLSIIL